MLLHLHIQNESHVKGEAQPRFQAKGYAGNYAACIIIFREKAPLVLLYSYINRAHLRISDNKPVQLSYAHRRNKTSETWLRSSSEKCSA